MQSFIEISSEGGIRRLLFAGRRRHLQQAHLSIVPGQPVEAEDGDDCRTPPTNAQNVGANVERERSLVVLNGANQRTDEPAQRAADETSDVDEHVGFSRLWKSSVDRDLAVRDGVHQSHVDDVVKDVDQAGRGAAEILQLAQAAHCA
ncbi:MAG: hypothetical protein BJ554DRAFT_1640, partial [Olpidium bornovanus]